ncbi:gamma-glutamylcyclotransferase family protein [Alicyclobacillus sp.]|uniref:gamma-glutamylcyclotransferase family protein n=1 Tax=Alicyclobacillus sp. TaxID=61169 RepID=UPI0025B8A4A6|nr:gamma-glutamylcyclotransferase family protein [Alicyclobacillus sp.]MCL6516980.1 gamma-glutamylcyclotransferase [Alicyclobacillus sp.]
MDHLVFVYGSLREGEQNHHFLRGAVRVARRARVHGRLYDTGEGYPAMIPDETAWTQGEVYRVDDQALNRIDWLEDYHGEGRDNLYNRRVMRVETEVGPLEAFVYVYADEDAARMMREVPNGDWGHRRGRIDR